jgi:NAD(P)-dependent dehydrogenase (short-subunit alcohol dehydrogenase family)
MSGKNSIVIIILLGRHAEPEAVTAPFAFLASEEASYITGYRYVINVEELAGRLASR